MDSEKRTARQVIDQAIRENQLGLLLLYLFSSIFVVLGIIIIVVGLFRDSAIISLVGCLESSLFWPAMNAARRTRNENIAIRLLELPLSQAGTAKMTMEMLKDIYYFKFGELPQEKPNVDKLD